MQEGPLHISAKATIAELLALDALTTPGSVIVDEYLSTPSGRRRPDVRAVYGGHRLAVEVQLATTQIPIIVGREDFYETESFRMLWVTCDFHPPPPGGRLLSSFDDIFHSHGKNVFSLDGEIVAISRARGEFTLRVFWRQDGTWVSKPVAVSGLGWLPGGLGNAVPPETPWNEALLARWRSVTDEQGTPWHHREALMAELAGRLGDPRVPDEELHQAADLVNCLLSLIAGRPVGSKQRNLVEVLN